MLSATNSNAAKLYKWVDANGKISYQDTPPPENSKLLKESTIKTATPDAAPTTGALITVYTVEECAACDQMTNRLRELDVPFNEQSLMDRDTQAEIISASESLTAPTLRIGGQYYSGLSDAELLLALQKAGHEPKLNQAKSALLNAAQFSPDQF